jgi:hypothetical protein
MDWHWKRLLEWQLEQRKKVAEAACWNKPCRHSQHKSNLPRTKINNKKSTSQPKIKQNNNKNKSQQVNHNKKSTKIK